MKLQSNVSAQVCVPLEQSFLSLCRQFNISETWYTRKNDVIGFANLADVGLVTYNTSDTTGESGTRWVAEVQTARFPPQVNDVVLFRQTSGLRFSVAVRVGQSTSSL